MICRYISYISYAVNSGHSGLKMDNLKNGSFWTERHGLYMGPARKWSWDFDAMRAQHSTLPADHCVPVCTVDPGVPCFLERE